MKKYYLIIYTPVIQQLFSQGLKWKNEIVSTNDFSYYYSFPITLVKCSDGKVPKKEYNY